MKTILFSLTNLLTLIIFLLMPAFSHHAMEFIEMESYSTARSGEFVFHCHYDYMVDDKNETQADHYEITPGLSYGIFDRLMIDIHTHFAKFGQSHLDNDNPTDLAEYQAQSPDGPPPFIEAAAVALQFRVTEHDQLPIDIAVSPFFELPAGRAKNLLNSEDVIGGFLIISRNFGLHNNITANFSYERDGDENVYGWAAGAKFVLSTIDEHAPAIGIEVIGDYDGHFGIMPGIYANILQNTVFKAGIFIGLSQYRRKADQDFQEEKEEDLRANVTIMTRW